MSHRTPTMSPWTTRLLPPKFCVLRVHAWSVFFQTGSAQTCNISCSRLRKDNRLHNASIMANYVQTVNLGTEPPRRPVNTKPCNGYTWHGEEPSAPFEWFAALIAHIYLVAMVWNSATGGTAYAVLAIDCVLSLRISPPWRGDDGRLRMSTSDAWRSSSIRDADKRCHSVIGWASCRLSGDRRPGIAGLPIGPPARVTSLSAWG